MDSLQPTCIIVAPTGDAHVASVLPHLSAHTLPFVIDYTEIEKNSVVTMLPGAAPEPSLQLDLCTGQSITFNKVETVWWKWPHRFSMGSHRDEAIGRYVRDQHEGFWAGFWASLPKSARWYNPIDAARAAARKLHQFAVAHRVGLRMPETVVTSNPRVARDFIQKHGKVAVKSIRASHPRRSTKLIHDGGAYDLDSLTICPAIFQAYIDARREFRVTVIDECVETVEFDLSSSRYPIDVKVDEATPACVSAIPAAVTDKLKQFMKQYDLRYSAFDIRLDSANEYFLLENNPFGEFLYLHHQASMNIALSMGRALSSRSTTVSIPILPTVTSSSFKIADGMPFVVSLEHQDQMH